MTDYDRDVIEEWRKGFAKKRDVFGVQPDIWDRVQYLRDRGYRRFPHVQAVLGRRASKGLMGGVLGAEQVAYFYSLDDWQAHYGIDPGQDGYLNVFATSQSQAQRFQFADIRRTVENCKYLQSAISTSKEYYFSIRTPADVRKIAELKSAGVVVEREIATLKAIALSANSSSGRGAVSFANFFDEFAFLIQGTGSNKSDTEIYESSQPSLDQFGKDALTYIPSSPFTKSGHCYHLYQQGSILLNSYDAEHDGIKPQDMSVDFKEAEDEIAADPEMLVFQGPSWAQPLTTPVLTPQGWRPMGDLQVGDFVIGSDGLPTKVTGVRQTDDTDVYRVTMNDGSSTRCSAGHLWRIEDWNERARNMKSRNTVASTAEIAQLLPGDPKHPRTFIPIVSNSPEFDTLDDELPISPYLLGYLLGDGCFRVGNSPRVALTEPEQNVLVEEALHEKFPKMQLVFHSGADWGITSGYKTPETCSLCGEPPVARGLCSHHYYQASYRGDFNNVPKIWGNPLGHALGELGLMGLLGPEKFVPTRYLIASPQARLLLLQGLMDADGTYAPGKHAAVFFNVSEKLCQAVVELAESLGGQGRMYWRPARRAGTLPSWHVSIRIPGILNPFRLPRKADAYLAGIKERQRALPVRKIVSVEPDEQEEMQCIEVAAENGLYITEHYIVTHNCLYEDWDRGGELVNVRFKRPVQPDLGSEIQQRRKRRNPEKFKVEREGQWAEVESAYLDPDKVDEAFVHPDWREPLEPQTFGRVDRRYRIHCDPGRVNANFAMAVAHLEDMPPDEHGDIWPCAIFDYLKVWKPSDYLDHTIDYIEVEKEIKDVLRRFPSTAKISFDQWNSASFLANIRKEFSPNIRVVEEIATERVNQSRCEKFKSALNLEWVKCFAGETKVLTPTGAVPIKELFGSSHQLMTTNQVDGRGGGKWVEAEVRSFGVQPLMKLTLIRNGVEKVVHVTAEHRWFINWVGQNKVQRREVLTKDLKSGYGLSYCIMKRHIGTDPSPIGIAHGFTFGDGTRTRKGSCVSLFGEKDKALLPYFDMHKIVDTSYSYGGENKSFKRVLNLPRFFKEKVDLAESPSYLYGWLAGYVAADGHVFRDGRVELDSSFPENLEHVRAVCNLLGIYTTSIRKKPQYGSHPLPNGTFNENPGYAIMLDRECLTESFFVIDEHRRRFLDNISRKVRDRKGWRVVSVEQTDRVEEVFCAVVPETHSFVLEDNILTGNCYLDHFGEDGNCLLEQELKFLTEKNGKVMKQDFGPCVTKDLFDAVSIVTTDLLHDALDRWAMKLATGSSYGTTDVAGMRSGRELERIGGFQGASMDRRGSLAREMLTSRHADRARSQSRMDRQSGFPTRGRVGDHREKPYMPSSSRKKF